MKVEEIKPETSPTAPPPKEIIEIVNQIKFRSVRLCVITLDQMNFSENASIYFPESIFPFTRIYEPKNRSEALAPKGKTCIVIEVPCNSDDTIYQLSNNEFVAQIKTILIDNNIIDSKKVINSTSEILQSNGLEESIMVDMSHGNSSKQHKKQIDVCKNISDQISAGEDRITGVMIESNLVEGNQKADDLGNLVYGKSITDACIDWQDTVDCLHRLAEAVDKRKN